LGCFACERFGGAGGFEVLMWGQMKTGEGFGEPGPTLELGPSLLRGRWRLAKKERRFAKKSPGIRVFAVSGVRDRAGALVRLVLGSPRHPPPSFVNYPSASDSSAPARVSREQSHKRRLARGSDPHAL
jgi:hypothetical protein